MAQSPGQLTIVSRYLTVSGALARYRVMAMIVGVMLIVVFVCIPFDRAESVIGPIHGALYIIYLVTVLDLVIRARLRFWALVAMVVSGWVPFVAFFTERWVTRTVRPRIEPTI